MKNRNTKQKKYSGQHSLMGFLFAPQFGTGLRPLGEHTQLFLQLLLMVFSNYGLIPKDYGVSRKSARLSLFDILATAFEHLRFTREGAPAIILFFAVAGFMAITAYAVIAALASFFIGTAHAQTTSIFVPESQDVAQAWINYLFNAVPLPNYFTSMGEAVPQTIGLQAALASALGFYSTALLIVAAFVLFYHLTTMVVETAHHGVAMGKRASQIWAPIRLVVAIGLLVPVNGGLNCGQYIVIKAAELGSGLASQVWDVFLNSMINYAPNAIPPDSPIVTQIAADLIASEACMYDYNTQLNLFAQNLPGLSSQMVRIIPEAGQTVGGHIGTKYSFSSPDLAGQDMCGWYFIPDPPAVVDTASSIQAQAYTVEAVALINALPSFALDGQQIISIMPTGESGLGSQSDMTLDPHSMNDVIAYQSAVQGGISALALSVQSPASAMISTLQPYGWVFAGTLLPTVERTQEVISTAVSEGMPQTQPPQIILDDNGNFYSGILTYLGLIESYAGGSNIRRNLAEDLKNFNILMSKSWAQKQAQNSQCAAMLGLQDSSQGSSWGSSAINIVLHAVDMSASWNGVWTNGMGNPCAAGSNGTGLATFKLGIDLTASDVFAQIIKLGHANLDTAFDILTVAVAGHSLGGVGGAIGGAIGGAGAGSTATPLGALAGGITGAAIGAGIGSALSAFSGFLDFIAAIFFACGFTLAFILPMFAFARFFFAVLSWVAALIEAVIGVPLWAIAHLNPEGDGLAGYSAHAGYSYIFNIFLRPTLTVFGLVVGLLMFMVAASFLTYAYSLAVAASGGTAYGHAVLAKIIYSVMYVAMMYVCANHSFALIDYIPDNALRWLGTSGQAMPRIGDPEKLTSYETALGSYIGGKGMSSLSQGARNLSQAVGQATQTGANRKGRMAQMQSSLSNAP